MVPSAMRVVAKAGVPAVERAVSRWAPQRVAALLLKRGADEEAEKHQALARRDGRGLRIHFFQASRHLLNMDHHDARVENLER